MPHQRAIIAVVGATATGKSALGLALAEALGGEIVNADAMQLYRGMDIGTAKLAPGERRGIRHHQLDVLDVTQEASVATYQRAARADLDAIAGRPILVGGSGLYVRAALDSLDIPPTDPAAAEHILPTKARRVVRALEVNELTGAPFLAVLPERTYRMPTITIGLRRDRGELNELIARRAEAMWADGLVEEVDGLLPLGLRDGRTARTAIGYQQALAQLDGELTQRQAIDATIAATRRFVRRQESWFRPDPRIHWLDAASPDLISQALALIR